MRALLQSKDYFVKNISFNGENTIELQTDVLPRTINIKIFDNFLKFLHYKIINNIK